MAVVDVTEAYAGTEAVGVTEHSMTTDTAGPDVTTANGIYVIYLDLSDMIAGDELQVRVYEKVQSTDTQRIVYQSNLVGAQGNPNWYSIPFVLMHGWDATLDAIAGTITVTWSIRQVGA